MATLTSTMSTGWLNTLAECCRWLLVGLMAYILATTVLYFAADRANANLPAPATQQLEPALQDSNFDLSAVQSRNLFGRANPNAVVAEKDEPLAETRLPLELQGVFVADEEDDSAAIVAPKNKAGKLYTVGEVVPGNATLIEVYADHVILRRAGIRETLRFFSNDGGFVAEHDEPEPPPRSKNRSQNRAQAATNQAAGPKTPKEFLDTYREQLTTNPGELLKELDVSPVSSDGSNGYRLGNLANSPYLNRTGLQPGDVVLSVNGRPVGDVKQDSLELGNLVTQGSARLEVQRGSRRFYVTASLK